MKQGVLTSQRVRLLMSKGHSCYRPRTEGERKRKSVRGCIVSSEISALSLVVVKKGGSEIPGLTDTTNPRRHFPKRATRIRKLFNLSKKDDVKEYNIKRKIKKPGKKARVKQPKIQRLITPQRLQRKRALKAEKKQRYEKSKDEAKVYNDLIKTRLKDQKDKRGAVISKNRGTDKKDDKKSAVSKKSTDKKQDKKTEKGATAKPKAQKPKSEAAKPKKPAAASSGAEKKKDKATPPAASKPKDSKPKTEAAKPKTKPAK